MDSIPLPGWPTRRAREWPVPRGQAGGLARTQQPWSMASCGLATGGWPWWLRGSAIGRRGIEALGPRSRWDRAGKLVVLELAVLGRCSSSKCGCECDEAVCTMQYVGSPSPFRLLPPGTLSSCLGVSRLVARLGGASRKRIVSCSTFGSLTNFRSQFREIGSLRTDPSCSPPSAPPFSGAVISASSRGLPGC